MADAQADRIKELEAVLARYRQAHAPPLRRP